MRECRNWSAPRSRPSPRDGEIAMTSLQRRIRKLEAYVAVHEVVVPDWAVVMRERKRRRAEAEGRTYVAPEPVIVDDPNDWAQVMRACRARRVAEWERAKEAEQ